MSRTELESPRRSLETFPFEVESLKIYPYPEFSKIFPSALESKTANARAPLLAIARSPKHVVVPGLNQLQASGAFRPWGRKRHDCSLEVREAHYLGGREVRKTLRLHPNRDESLPRFGERCTNPCVENEDLQGTREGKGRERGLVANDDPHQ